MTNVKHIATLETLVTSAYSADLLVAAGMSRMEADRKGERFARCAAALGGLGHQLGERAVAVFVPGRIEVLGKHTDYCGGRSLLCTVERGMCFVAVTRADASIHFNALDLGEAADMAIDPALQPTPRHWSNYPMTIARRIACNFPGSTLGADIVMSSDLPAASGLSSSSAMIVGSFLVIADINALQSTAEYTRHIRLREDLAGYLGCIENGQSFGALAGDCGVGTLGGSQDHTAILCSKPGQLSIYSFCPVMHEQDIALPEDMRFIIADSGVVAEKTGDVMERYNRVSCRAQELVRRWNENTMTPAHCVRDIAAANDHALELFKAALQVDDSSEASMELFSRLNQFILESRYFIPDAALAIANHDWSALRSVVNQSQRHAESDLQNQVSQSIQLQKELLDAGATAASAFGAGFGGSVWGLFHRDTLADIQTMQAISRLKAFITRPGCAAITLSSLQ